MLAPTPRGLSRVSVTLPASITEAPHAMGVYLLAFVYRGEHAPLGTRPGCAHAGAAHYLGWAHDIAERTREHATGRGGPLTLAAFLAGYELRLVAYWPGATRTTERAMKRTHRLARYCPLCKYRLDPAPIPAPVPVSTVIAAEELLGVCELSLAAIA